MITDFLHRLMLRPFRWGETDCALVLADWLMATGRNQDFAEGLRGTYRSEAECAAVMAAHGGLLRLVARRAKEAGLVRQDEAMPGDIGVIRMADQDGRARHFGAIRAMGGAWAVKCHHGLRLVRDVRVAAVWGVGCHF